MHVTTKQLLYLLMLTWCFAHMLAVSFWGSASVVLWIKAELFVVSLVVVIACIAEVCFRAFDDETM